MKGKTRKSIYWHFFLNTYTYAHTRTGTETHNVTKIQQSLVLSSDIAVVLSVEDNDAST